MRLAQHSTIIRTLLAFGLAGLVSCSGAPGIPGVPGGGGGNVDPNTCGSYAANATGKKLKKFLTATVALEKAVKNTENYAKDTCKMMGKKLGIAPSGDTKAVCAQVSAALKDHLKVGLKAGAAIELNYEPAVCTVNIEAAASAAAECEAQANAEVGVICSGTCTGTCNGECAGECVGGTGGSACDAQCKGECKGECKGGCEGYADVNASAECRAHAEVTANVEAECTEPKVEVKFEAGLVVDKSKLDAAVAAIEVGLPRILMVKAKMTGPVKKAVATWTKSAKQLAENAFKVAASVGDQARCVGGQLKAAAGMVGGIAGSASISVEVSVEVSASASGSAG